MADDPRLIFLSAEAFRLSAEELFVHLEQEGTVHYIFPITMHRAFACELYLKCLLTIDGKTVPQHHRLHDLFEGLSDNLKQEMVGRYDSLAKTDPWHELFFKKNTHFKSDLRSVLGDSSKVFAKIRYAYELIPENPKIHTRFTLPTEAARALILNLHPEWISKR